MLYRTKLDEVNLENEQLMRNIYSENWEPLLRRLQ